MAWFVPLGVSLFEGTGGAYVMQALMPLFRKPTSIVVSGRHSCYSINPFLVLVIGFPDSSLVSTVPVPLRDPWFFEDSPGARVPRGLVSRAEN